MNTRIEFYDENNILKYGNIIFLCEFNDKKYIVYDKDEDSNDENDIIYVGEYVEEDKVYVYEVSDEELEVIKTQISIILRSLD